MSKGSILITGAGTGIGAAAAERLAESGHRIILCGRRTAPLQEVHDRLSGEGHLVLPMDTSDKAVVHEALHGGALQGHKLLAVFANAGIGGANEYGEEDRWEEIIDINLSGVYFTVMESLPLLRASGHTFKHVLITSSCLARFGVPNYTAYCASKSGLTGLTRALAVELASEKILVNAILPGWVDTEMARAGIQLLADDTGKPYTETHEEQMGFVPLGKMSDPEELGHLVNYLFSEGQRSMTGQCIDFNNGSFMI